MEARARHGMSTASTIDQQRGRCPRRPASPVHPDPGPTKGVLMSWLSGSWPDLAIAAAKAVLMYLTALVGLRLGERRTMAQWTGIDFAATVAIGAIIGRTAVASSQPFAVGAVALVAIIAVHRLASLGRFTPVIGALVDHPVRVLVVDGRVRRRQLRLSGLTDDDLYAALRQRGVFDGGRAFLRPVRGQGRPDHRAPRPGRPCTAGSAWCRGIGRLRPWQAVASSRLKGQTALTGCPRGLRLSRRCERRGG